MERGQNLKRKTNVSFSFIQQKNAFKRNIIYNNGKLASIEPHYDKSSQLKESEDSTNQSTLIKTLEEN